MMKSRGVRLQRTIEVNGERVKFVAQSRTYMGNPAGYKVTSYRVGRDPVSWSFQCLQPTEAFMLGKKKVEALQESELEGEGTTTGEEADDRGYPIDSPDSVPGTGDPIEMETH